MANTDPVSRFATVGGALVGVYPTNGDYVAKCGGCSWTSDSAYLSTLFLGERAAQKHADTCRAISREDSR